MHKHRQITDSRGMFMLENPVSWSKTAVQVYLPAFILQALSFILLSSFLPLDFSMGNSFVLLAISLLFPTFLCVYSQRMGLRVHGFNYVVHYEEGRRFIFGLLITWGAAFAFMYYTVFAWEMFSVFQGQLVLTLCLILGNILLSILNYELASYIFFGVMTYLVSVASFSVADYFVQSFIGVDVAGTWIIALGFSFFCAVAFAYITNRRYVFVHKGNFWHDFIKFVMARVVSSLLIEVLGMAIAIDWLGFDRDLSRSMASIAVTVANYFLSKFFVFRKDLADNAKHERK